MRFRIKPQYMSASLVTLIIVLGEVFFDILGGWGRMALALGAACLTEAVLSRLLRRVWPNYTSAYISGNSVAILTKPAPGLLWPFCLGSTLAIASKYVLRYRGRHLWNPTNFSICALLLLAPGSMSILSHQWSNSPLAVGVIFAVGFIVVTRAKLLHVTGTYVVAFAVLAALRAAILGESLWTELAPLTGPMYMLLIFFMITDPKTTVRSKAGRVWVTVLIALAECGIRLMDHWHVPLAAPLLTAPPLFALFVVGPAAMWWDLRRRARAEAAPRTVPAAAG